jgi:hypothetical protein
LLQRELLVPLAGIAAAEDFGNRFAMGRVRDIGVERKTFFGF